METPKIIYFQLVVTGKAGVTVKILRGRIKSLSRPLTITCGYNKNNKEHKIKPPVLEHRQNDIIRIEWKWSASSKVRWPMKRIISFFYLTASASVHHESSMLELEILSPAPPPIYKSNAVRSYASFIASVDYSLSLKTGDIPP